jgi:hypothetical protein
LKVGKMNLSHVESLSGFNNYKLIINLHFFFLSSMLGEKKAWASAAFMEVVMGLNGRVGTGAEAGGQLVLVWGGVRGLLQLRPGLELGELLVLGLTKGWVVLVLKGSWSLS